MYMQGVRGLRGLRGGADIVPAQERFFDSVIKMFDQVAGTAPPLADLIALQAYLAAEWSKFKALALSSTYDQNRSAAAIATLKPYVDERLRNVAAWIAAATPAQVQEAAEQGYAPSIEPVYYAPSPGAETPGIIQINPPAGSGGRTLFVPSPTQAPPPGYSYSPNAAPPPAAAGLAADFDLDAWVPWIIGGAAAGFLLLRK